MGDILSKLQMVSEKIGVTETAHTIEEHVDLISESLDKIPHSTNIAEALDDLSDVAQNINNEEVYIDKTITENGTYLPAEDEATAYSKVTVNVPINFSKIKIPIIGYFETLSQLTPAPASIKRSSDGVYTLEEEKLICVDPLKSIIFNTEDLELFSVVFTPAENNTIVSDIESHLYKTITGDTITAGDGKQYLIYLHRDPTTGTQVLTCKKSNRDFVFTIE